MLHWPSRYKGHLILIHINPNAKTNINVNIAEIRKNMICIITRFNYQSSVISGEGDTFWSRYKWAGESHNHMIHQHRLTPSLRRPYIHKILFSTACRTACKHAFRFLRVLPEAVSTRHSWLWQTLDDVYTRRCFSESEGTRFGAPGQRALPSVNEFTLLWIFA